MTSDRLTTGDAFKLLSCDSYVGGISVDAKDDEYVFSRCANAPHCYDQIPDDHYIVRSDLPDSEIEKYRKIGLEAISKGHLCVLVLCGGQASRLGTDKPKGTFSLSLGSPCDTLLQIQASQIVRLIKEAENAFPGTSPRIPWFVMVSKSTNDAVRDHLKEISINFGISMDDIVIFEQKEIPCLGFDGGKILKSVNEIATAPNGNGGIYDALKEHLDLLEERGVKYVHTYCVDNILCRVGDPVFVGSCISVNADCAAKVIEKRTPEEKVGVICMEKSRPVVVEYSEISKEMAEKRTCDGLKLMYRAGSIANHFFTLDFLKRVCSLQLPYHIVKKKIPFYNPDQNKLQTPTQPNGIKLERFIFDVFPESKNFYVFQVDPSKEFSPLKNADAVGEDCPSTCRRDYLNRLHDCS